MNTPNEMSEPTPLPYDYNLNINTLNGEASTIHMIRQSNGDEQIDWLSTVPKRKNMNAMSSTRTK